MKKRGQKPKGKVKIVWSSNMSYAIGLLTTDGCLSSDGRHILLTSKDKEQLNNFSKAIGTKLKIGINKNGHGQTAFRVQFGDVLFYSFLEKIGLSKAKSLVLGKVKIPPEYFFDFLRGCFDGDGCSYSYWDPRWRSSFMCYVSFASGSQKFLKWLQKEIYGRLKIKSHIAISRRKPNLFYQLRYSKYAAIKLIKEMYKSKDDIFLKRKKLKIDKMLVIVDERNARVL